MQLKRIYHDEIIKSKNFMYSSESFVNGDETLDFYEYIKNKKDYCDYLYSIINDNNQVVGIVSLHSFNTISYAAELEILVFQKARGKGYAWYALTEILDKAFNQITFKKVFWKVKRSDIATLNFFKRYNFNELDGDLPNEIINHYSSTSDFFWFAVLDGDDYRGESIRRGLVSGCKVLSIKTIPTIEAGELSFFEAINDIPFEIKRLYYISKVPQGVRRGFHAHKNLKQLLFCPFGKIKLILENNFGREEFILSDPSIGILIDKPTWREMLWLEDNSVLVVAASEYYDVNDYIRDYDLFKKYIEGDGNL